MSMDGEEAELGRQRAFLQMVVDHLPISVYCKDAKNGFAYILWNQLSEKLSGIPAVQALGKTDADLFPAAQAELFLRKDQEIVASGQALDVPEDPVAMGSEGLRYHHTRKIPLPDERGELRYLLGIAEDVTERVLAEKALECERAVALHAARMASLGEMSAGIAHEINNPLAVIIGKAQSLRLLHERGELDGETMRQSLDSIVSTADRIAKIVRGLRAFSREGSDDPFERARLTDIFEDTLSFCRARFRHHRVDLQVDDVPDGLKLQCRSSQISQVLLNLLNNSLDAVDPLPEKWVRISVLDLGDSVEISVTDSGKGVALEIRDRIMQPFFTTKQVGKGTGLGLSISRGIVDAHRGVLELDPVSPQTRFFFRLPKTQSSFG